MSQIDLEKVLAAMFVGPGVKAIDDLRLIPFIGGKRQVTATIRVAEPSVDLDLVRAVIAKVLVDQFGIEQVVLCFKDPGPAAPPPTGPPLKKM
jgi:Co/Zn/Cd efflux system component